MPEAAMILDDPSTSALVLSGGGMRGAYEVGVIAGLVELLELKAGDPPPFQIFVGTSVGSLNAAWLAANAHRGDMGIGGLLEIWQDLQLREHLRLDLFGWRRPLTRLLSALGISPSTRGHSLLDPMPLERLVRSAVPWDQLHENIRSGRILALVTPALEVASGRTHMFAELAPGLVFHPSRDPHRLGVTTPITADHVLASAAIPVIFPPRRVGEHYFYDGGIRHNTPIAPALRLGAQRLMIVASMPSEPTPAHVREEQPSLGFLAGKLLNAVLLDPVSRDLMVLQRLNHLLEVLEEVVTPAELEQIQEVLIETRGAPYRRVAVLPFRPGADLGRLAMTHLRGSLDKRSLGLGPRLLLKGLASEAAGEADWVSYLLFDGELARRMIAVGRQDVAANAAAVRAFFSTRA